MHACLAIESAISFPKILLCHGIHLFSESLKVESEGSRPVDFPSRATHRDWESVNIATEEFCGTPVCIQCNASSKTTT